MDYYFNVFLDRIAYLVLGTVGLSILISVFTMIRTQTFAIARGIVRDKLITLVVLTLVALIWLTRKYGITQI